MAELRHRCWCRSTLTPQAAHSGRTRHNAWCPNTRSYADRPLTETEFARRPGSATVLFARRARSRRRPAGWLACGRGSVGRASPCQGEGRGFESRRPLGDAEHRRGQPAVLGIHGEPAGCGLIGRRPGSFRGGVAEWFRQGPAKPCTRVRFPSPPPMLERHLTVGQRRPCFSARLVRLVSRFAESFARLARPAPLPARPRGWPRRRYLPGQGGGPAVVTCPAKASPRRPGPRTGRRPPKEGPGRSPAASSVTAPSCSATSSSAGSSAGLGPAPSAGPPPSAAAP